MRRLTPNHFWILFAVLLAVLPWFSSSNFYRHLLIITCLHAIMALSLNLVTGFTGLLSLGHSAFVAVGAYTGALLTLAGYSFWVGALAGAALSFVAGILIGLPSLRLRGIYLGLVTWGLAETVRLVALNSEFTRGPHGLPRIPAITLFGQTMSDLWQIYYVIGFFLLVCCIICTRLVESRLGDAWLAPREDELAAEAMGVNTLALKVLAFGISATMTGVAGAFYASYFKFIDPNIFNIDLSILILTMVVVGGLGSIPGSLLGALLLTVLPETIRFLQDYRLLLYGLVLIVMMIYRPQGILGHHRHLLWHVFWPVETEKSKGGLSSAS